MLAPRVRADSVALLLAVLVLVPVAHAQKLTPDEVLLRNYTLTMPKVEAWATASLDVANAMKAMPASEKARRKAEMEAQANEQEAETIAGMAATMERVPEVRRAFRKSGLTAREGVTLSLVLMQAVLFDQVAAANPDAKVPYNMNPANLAFVRKNKAQLQARMKAVQEASKEADDEPAPDEPSPDEPTPDAP
jgi:type II secretory pathway component GspD/PulD (secretin)